MTEFRRAAVAAAVLSAALGAEAADPVPYFIDEADLRSPVFECLVKEDAAEKYTPEEQRLVDKLWDETLVYLGAFAKALTTDTTGRCLRSDEAVYETAGGVKSFCVTDREDIRRMVKQIHQILANPKAAKACFSPRRGDKTLMMPEGKMLERSPVAQWINRPRLSDYFKTASKNPEVAAYGAKFAAHFDEMAAEGDIAVPPQFGRDVSAKALPNLWAAVGWVPMYAADSARNKRNFTAVRGGYAYGEILGHWGLLRIKSINGVPVGAEIGMTVQSVGTLYPYHNHAITELYYTLRRPAKADQLNSFAVRADNRILKTVSENRSERTVEFDSRKGSEADSWAPTAFDKAPLVYFHENTIHAFDMKADGEAHPESRAMVAVWARGNADDKRNDYGNTRLCENAEQPDTPALKGGVIRCQLTQQKW
ncbi:MAG: Lipoprotein [Burkholderia sp.]|jgi:hypothetical protein